MTTMPETNASLSPVATSPVSVQETSGVPITAPFDPLEPNKKKIDKRMLLLIIGIIVLLIVLAAGALGWRYYRWTRPEKITLDIMNQLANAPGMSVTITYDTKALNPDLEISSIHANSHNQFSYPSWQGRHQLAITTQSRTQTLQINNILDDEGNNYINVNGIATFLNSLNQSQKRQLHTILATALENGRILQAENQWWQTQHDELTTLTHTDKTATDAIDYSCLYRQFASGNHLQIAAIYQENPFIKLQLATTSPIRTTSGHHLYTGQIEANQLSNFLFQLGKQFGFSQCIANNNWLQPQQVSQWVRQIKNLILEVDTHNHQLTKVYLEGQNDDYVYTLDLNLDNSAINSVTPPENSQPLANFLQSAPNFGHINGREATDAATMAEVEYLQATTPDERNLERINALNLAADALETCYNTSIDRYTSDNLQESGQIEAHQTGGPFAQTSNQCLPGDISPSVTDYPYYYSFMSHIPYQQFAGFVLCASLEPTVGWQYLGNSNAIINSNYYLANGTWKSFPPCRRGSSNCYYCRSNIRRLLPLEDAPVFEMNNEPEYNEDEWWRNY